MLYKYMSVLLGSAIIIDIIEVVCNADYGQPFGCPYGLSMRELRWRSDSKVGKTTVIGLTYFRIVGAMAEVCHSHSAQAATQYVIGRRVDDRSMLWVSSLRIGWIPQFAMQHVVTSEAFLRCLQLWVHGFRNPFRERGDKFPSNL